MHYQNRMQLEYNRAQRDENPRQWFIVEPEATKHAPTYAKALEQIDALSTQSPNTVNAEVYFTGIGRPIIDGKEKEYFFKDHYIVPCSATISLLR